MATLTASTCPKYSHDGTADNWYTRSYWTHYMSGDDGSASGTVGIGFHHLPFTSMFEASLSILSSLRFVEPTRTNSWRSARILGPLTVAPARGASPQLQAHVDRRFSVGKPGRSINDNVPLLRSIVGLIGNREARPRIHYAGAIQCQ